MFISLPTFVIVIALAFELEVCVRKLRFSSLLQLYYHKFYVSSQNIFIRTTFNMQRINAHIWYELICRCKCGCVYECVKVGSAGKCVEVWMCECVCVSEDVMLVWYGYLMYSSHLLKHVIIQN